MFTGIIKAVGTIKSFDQDVSVLTVACPLFAETKLMVGASIAIDGVCLTVSHLDGAQPNLIGFDLGQETINVTLLAHKKPGDIVNIEPALRLGDAIDGHMVQGHIDAIGHIESIKQIDQGCLLSVGFPPALAPYLVNKGSIAVDGVSLTVNEIRGHTIGICLVPHTIENTSFSAKKPGDFVHLETDIVGRYMHHFYSRGYSPASPLCKDLNP